MKRNTMQYLKKYCWILTICGDVLGGGRQECDKRERCRPSAYYSRGLLVWHNFYLIFNIVSQVIFPPLSVTFLWCSPQSLEHIACTVHISITCLTFGQAYYKKPNVKQTLHNSHLTLSPCQQHQYFYSLEIISTSAFIHFVSSDRSSYSVNGLL